MNAGMSKLNQLFLAMVMGSVNSSLANIMIEIYMCTAPGGLLFTIALIIYTCNLGTVIKINIW